MTHATTLAVTAEGHTGDTPDTPAAGCGAQFYANFFWLNNQDVSALTFSCVVGQDGASSRLLALRVLARARV